MAWRPDRRTHYTLQSWNAKTGSFEALLATNNADLVQPALVEARPVPNQHPSRLHDWDYANLLCLNAYTAKYNNVGGCSISSAWLDYDKDGCIDLFVGRYVKFDPKYRAYYAADNYPGRSITKARATNSTTTTATGRSPTCRRSQAWQRSWDARWA